MVDDLQKWAEARVYELAQVEDLLQNWGKWAMWPERIGPQRACCQSIEKRWTPRYPGSRDPREDEPINSAAVAVEKIMRHVPGQYKYALLDYYGVYRRVPYEELRLKLTASTLRTSVTRVEKRLEIGRGMVLNLLKRAGVDLWKM